MKGERAIFALKRLHANLSRELRRNEKLAKKIRANMIHVEAVLRLLDPAHNYAALAAKRAQRLHRLFGKRGESIHTAYALLRASTKPLSVRELTLLMYHDKGIAEPSEGAMNGMTHRLRRIFDRERGKTVMGDERWPEKWSIIPPVPEIDK